MTETETFCIGDAVYCDDERCGEVRRVVVDPILKAVTHLVVEPKHGSGLGRLVPLDVVEKSDHEIRLRCSREAFERFDPAEETAFVPAGGHYPGYDQSQLMAWPYYTLGTPGTAADMPRTVTVETLPPGMISVRRGDRVEATDGEIGRVQGLVVEPATGHVSHVLLQEGHLWGRRQVAIPANLITTLEEGVAVRLSKQEIGELPPVEVEDFDSDPVTR